MSVHFQRLPKQDGSDMQRAWQQFVDSGEIEPFVRPEIADSWERCAARGLSPTGARLRAPISQDELAERRANAAGFMAAAKPVLEAVFAGVRPCNGAALLCDEEGYILDVLVEGSMRLALASQSITEGHQVTEDIIGTTALALCLRTGEPSSTVGEEHYLRAQHHVHCAAAPVYSGDEIAGGICITMPRHPRYDQPHLLGWAVATAQAAEHGLRVQDEVRKVALTRDYLRGALESYPDAVLLLDGKRRLRALNGRARELIGTQIHLDRNLVEQALETNLIDHDTADWLIQACSARKSAQESNLKLNGCGRAYCVSARPILQQGEPIGFLVHLRPEREHVSAGAQLSDRAQHTFNSLVGQAPIFLGAVELCRRAAMSDATVLLTGETGTGKELFAHAVHEASYRSERPFIAINCSAFPQELIENELFGHASGAFTGSKREGRVGKFELADGGTLFLDEVGELPLSVQAKLLRATECGEVTRLGDNKVLRLNTRIVAATNRDLEEAVLRGDFRADLYHRLNVLSIKIPPLRERPDDITLLVRHFSNEIADEGVGRPLEVDVEGMEYLRRYQWPGNVRELRNFIEKAFHLLSDNRLTYAACRSLGLDQGPKPVSGQQLNPLMAGEIKLNGSGHQQGASAVYALEDLKSRAVINALEKNDGNISATARQLGISRPTVYKIVRNLAPGQHCDVAQRA